MLIDDVLPGWDRREVHTRRVRAPRAAVWAAVQEVTGAEVRAIGVLMRVRGYGRRVGPGEAGPLLDAFGRLGFARLAEEPAREVVVGGTGRYWLPTGGIRRVHDRAEFDAFAEPGHVKAATNFWIDGPDGDVLVGTETRVLALDAAARRRFGLYWLAIRLGSGAIRISWLRAIERRSLSAPAPAAP